MDWTAIGAVGHCVATTIAFVVLVYAVQKDGWKRPTLSLRFEPDHDVKSQDNSRLWAGERASQYSRWLRIRVENTNRWKAAKNCKAYLTGIKNLATGEDLFPSDVRQLRWMHDHSEVPAGRDLLPGVVHWFDVLTSFHDRSRLAVCAFPEWGVDAPGDYLFSVQVSAEDTDPVALSVVVSSDGSWQSLTGRKHHA